MARIRLPADSYTTGNAWHLVLRAHEGSPFGTSAVAAYAVEQLRISASRYRMNVFAYCVMPDHVHLLVGNEDSSDVVRFVRHFKQGTGFRYRRETGTPLWQRSFFDRGIRSDEDLQTVAEYILRNPVTDGLAKEAGDYEWAGSFVWESVFDDETLKAGG